jgi:hypothetical protein
MGPLTACLVREAKFAAASINENAEELPSEIEVDAVVVPLRDACGETHPTDQPQITVAWRKQFLIRGSFDCP